MGRDDISVSIRQRVTAKSINHLATSIPAVVNLKMCTYVLKKICITLSFSSLYFIFLFKFFLSYSFFIL